MVAQLRVIVVTLGLIGALVAVGAGIAFGGQSSASDGHAADGASHPSSLDHVFSQLSTMDGFVDGGLVGDGSNDVHVHWEGDLTDDALAAIAAAQDRGVTVVVDPAAFTTAHIEDAGNRVLALLAQESVEVHRIGLLRGNAGIEFGIEESIAGAGLEALESLVKAEAAGVPVTLVPEPVTVVRDTMHRPGAD